MAQADWAPITCQPQQTTFATEWQALTYSGRLRALRFTVPSKIRGASPLSLHVDYRNRFQLPPLP